MSNITQSNNIIRRSSLFKYVGAASNLASRELRLCLGANTSGKYIFQDDIAPNFSLYFQATVPNWDVNSFRFGVHSEFQSFYYRCPKSNQLQLTDMNLNPLVSWTLNSNCMLSNAKWNTFKLVNSESNLIMTVNNYAYASVVPNWPMSGWMWKSGTFSFTASNSATQTGSNSIRRLFAQSMTSMSDPVIVHNSLTAQLLNTSRIGCTDVSTRVSSTGCGFVNYLFASNLYVTSNAAASNVSCVNANCGRLLVNTTSTGAYQAEVKGSTLLTTSSAAAPLQIFNSGLTSNASVGLLLGKADSNALSVKYMQGASNLNSYASIGLSNADMLVVTGSNVGIGTSNPWYKLDVSGAARIQSNLFVSGSVSASNLGAAAGCNVIPWSMIIGVPSSNVIKNSNITTSNLFVTENLFANNCSLSNVTIAQDLVVTNGQTVGNSYIGDNFRNATLHIHGDVEADYEVRCFRGAKIATNNVLQFGWGYSGLEANAGKIGYATFSSALDIVGTGNFGDPTRFVKVWDFLTVNQKLKITDNGTAIACYKSVTSANLTSGSRSLTITWTHSLGSTAYTVWASVEDIAASPVDDAFVTKVVVRNANDCQVRLIRVDANSGWTRPVNVILHLIAN